MKYDAAIREIQADLDSLNEDLRKLNAQIQAAQVNARFVDVVASRCENIARRIGSRLPSVSDIEHA